MLQFLKLVPRNVYNYQALTKLGWFKAPPNNGPQTLIPACFQLDGALVSHSSGAVPTAPFVTRDPHPADEPPVPVRGLRLFRETHG